VSAKGVSGCSIDGGLMFWEVEVVSAVSSRRMIGSCINTLVNLICELIP
jgi:hypothetical protein